MKKILCTFLIAFSIISVNAEEIFYTNNYALSMTEEQYNNLLQLGFTEKQIERMDENTFEENKNIQATLISQSIQYVRYISYLRNGVEIHESAVVSEDEFMQLKEHPEYQLRSPSGNYYTGILDNGIFAEIVTISNLSDNLMRYRLDVIMYDIPTTRSFDIYGIGIESGKVQVASTITCNQYWEYTNGTDDYTIGCYPKTESTGGSAMFELPSGNLDELDTYIYFSVSKKSGVGTITSLEAVGDYAHAISNTSSSVYNYYTTNLGGISVFSPYTTYYNLINSSPSAGFSGTW